ncbi:hypothetical protein ETAA8_60570 [Anatilimnocola aggregata]|uniref:Uncharacterized protein n=2 Tax=Anatilimnocola aggregata TaxID=2528021 RepID=A0A517YL22_9BACT|nr:hypothetical protein ETAA8_60570 [Anatilimnocola aggregata]
MPPTQSGLVGSLVSVVGLVLAGVYLANPGWGVIELLPDNLPGIGNIDEVVATTIFLTCLARLGINILPQRGPTTSERKN